MSWFLQPTHIAAHLFFERQKKIKELQANTQTKTRATKNCLKAQVT
jgi:hypothetical protein